MFPFSNLRWFQNSALYDDVGIFKSEDSVKWYECCQYVSLLDYDGTFSQPMVLVYSLKWYFSSRNVIHLSIKLSVYIHIFY